MRSLVNFVKYNNALPIALFLIFGMGSAAFAASPAAREQVLRSQEVVRSVDNTYIIEADLENFDFSLQVTAVAEDPDFYYVSYTYQTISIVDYVWKPATVKEVLKVGKLEILGRDLGLYVAKQLGEVIAGQKELLAGTQTAERKLGATPKVVATEYSGLIGKFLSPTETTFEGYDPVVEEKPLGDRVAAVGAAGWTTGGPAGSTAGAPVLTPKQVEQIVQDKVNAILAAGALPPPDTASTTPPAGDTGNDAPPAGTPPADEPPATTTPPADEPPADTPPAETPPADTSPVNEPPPAEPPPADTPPTETPPAETPPAETPPAETPSADTPSQ